MSVNTKIYGTPEQWFDVQTTNFDDENMKFKQAYIGSGGKRLQDGYGYGINLNQPIDKSLSWCALGNFSTWSKISYYKSSEDMALIAQDNRNATNFSLNKANGTQTGIYIGDVGTYNDSGTMFYGSIQRWSPKAINSYSSYQSNFNANVEPLTQIPLRNCVMVPYFRVAKQINNANNTTGMDIRNVLAWDYYGTTATGNHTTHPYILSITMLPYHLESKNVSIRTSTGSWRNSSILDEISLQKGIPKDFDEPEQEIMDMVYCYNIFSQPSSIYGWTIFGYTVNASGVSGSSLPDVIGFTDAPAGSGNTNDRRVNKIKGIVVYNHPNEVFSPAFQISQASEGTATVNTKGCFHYVEYYDNGDDDNIKEWVRKQIACFGLFFTDDKATAETGDFNDPLMCLGILDDNNIGQGFYSMGEDNENQKQWNWETTNDSDYDPSGGGSDTDPNSYDGSMRTHDLTLLDTATQRYALSPTAMVGLLDKLWNIMDQASPDQALTDYSVGEFLATNPIDCIVSLQFVPVSNINTGTLTTVKLGRHDTEISCQTAKLALKVDCGNYEIFPRFGNNWIDRMTKITLYLPFCGTVNLDPEVYMGRKINVEYLIDLSNGTCTAIVSFVGDGGLKVITDTASGSCAMDLPVTGIQQQTLNSQLFNASESVKQLKVNNAFKGFNSIVNGAMSLGSNNPANTISGILGAGQDIYNIFQSEKIADYNLQHTMIPTKMIGTSGGLTGAMLEYYPTIIFERPSLPEGFDDLGRSEQYAHSEGYACCISGSLSEFTGYTEILNVDLAGFDATITEKNMIRSVLAGGVYL